MNEETYCVEDCEKCPNLVNSRSQIVNGYGSKDADVMLVGEAPGENEDEQGEPFVGRSGTVLDDVLNSNNVAREDVRITNTVRCRPPENRDPTKEERSNCMTYLYKEIELVNPNVILTLGKVPTETLLDRCVAVTKICGDEFEIDINNTNYTVMACVHPAATLYDRSYKSMFEDTISKALDK